MPSAALLEFPSGELYFLNYEIPGDPSQKSPLFRGKVRAGPILFRNHAQRRPAIIVYHRDGLISTVE